VHWGWTKVVNNSVHKWSQRPGLASSARRSAIAIVSKSAAPWRVRDNFSSAGKKARVNDPRGVTRRGVIGCGEAFANGGVVTGTENVNEETSLLLDLLTLGVVTTGMTFLLPSRITTVDVELPI